MKDDHLRIGFVVFSLRIGGAERVASTLINGWARHGEEVSLLTVDPSDTDFYPIDGRVRRVALGLNIPSKSWLKSAATNARRVRLLRAFARSSKFDVIVSFGDKTNVLLLLATRGINVPVVVAEHCDPRRWNIGRTARYLRWLLYPRSSAVVALTPEVAKWARRIVRSDAVRVIPNPVGEQFLNHAQRSFRGEQRFVLAMGRLGFEKGFDLLLRAFALCLDGYPNWMLRLVGQGAEQQSLRNLAAQLQIQHAVRFEPVTREPERVFRECDLFVLSSRTEGFPLVLLEAMACGLPVVSFDCPSGPSAIIRNEVDGLLVPPGNVDELAKTMSRLMGNERELRRLAERAVEVTERFGLKSVMEMWNKVLKESVRDGIISKNDVVNC